MSKSLASLCAGARHTTLTTWHHSRAHLRQFSRDLRETPSASTGKPIASHTLHGYLRAVKSLLNWAFNESYIDERLTRKLETPKLDEKVVAIFTRKHIDALLHACDTDMGVELPQQAARDKAILAFLLDTGERANELCSLTLDNLHFTPQDAYALVDGKGRKQREVGLGRTARQYLHRYIHHYRMAYRPSHSERHVFLAKGGTPLTPEGLSRLLHSLRERAGITDIQVNAHRFRHTFAVNFMEQNNDVLRLSRTLGHTSLAVTDGYLNSFSSRSARQGKSVLDNIV